MMSWIIIGTFINAIALYVTALIIPGIQIDGFLTLVFSAIIVGLVNTFIKPIAQLISLPISVLTLGIFALIVNAAMLGLAAVLVPGWHIDGFWSAFWGAIILSLTSALLSAFFKPKNTY